MSTHATPTTGTLAYVIGASGAGKDSLMHYARSHCPPSAGLLFAHRYITRRSTAGDENHIELSVGEFLQRKSGGLFVMDWQSHDLHYGVGIEVEHWLSLGFNVVLNGSREYLPTARQRVPSLVPFLIQVETSVLHQRLRARGRESEENIAQRLARNETLNQTPIEGCRFIENNDTIERAGAHLLAQLLEL
ncbi:MAG: phosphonate metabolism protein/1,5-bisphosphokinase (PRPP-forming) PhnN [Opitutales bacterium]